MLHHSAETRPRFSILLGRSLVVVIAVLLYVTLRSYGSLLLAPYWVWALCTFELALLIVLTVDLARFLARRT